MRTLPGLIIGQIVLKRRGQRSNSFNVASRISYPNCLKRFVSAAFNPRKRAASAGSTAPSETRFANRLPLAFTHLQTLFTVYPVHCLVIDLTALPAQQNMQLPITKTTAFAGQLDEPFA